MTTYVRIPRISHVNDFAKLSERLVERGYSDTVEYNNGGWMDKEIGTVAPHLKFEVDTDAMAYVLAFGGEIFNEIPHEKY